MHMLSSVLVAGLSVATPLRALIIGGGPDLKHNQVAIESNVRYVGRLLPKDSESRVLFADGSMSSETVLYLDSRGQSRYRAPQLYRLDGPARKSNVLDEFAALVSGMQSNAKTPVLLYFTGHGSPNAASQYMNNPFDLWNSEQISVREVAAAIKGMPKQTPVALVMVECFSGAFGNLLFEDGDPTGSVRDQNLCGFFAAVPQRMAAGCTPEVNEANYRDFTSYFFAALTGTDRLGNPVTGADYDKNGKVGMNEAYIYTIIHDESIDTPVCTSDVFLRRFVTTPDPEIMSTPYGDVEKWASPAQLAALRALSSALGLDTDDRLTVAYNRFKNINMSSDRLLDVELIRFVRLAKSVVLAHTLTSSGDKAVQKRFKELVKAESANPLTP